MEMIEGEADDSDEVSGRLSISTPANFLATEVAKYLAHQKSRLRRDDWHCPYAEGNGDVVQESDVSKIQDLKHVRVVFSGIRNSA